MEYPSHIKKDSKEQQLLRRYFLYQESSSIDEYTLKKYNGRSINKI